MRKKESRRPHVECLEAKQLLTSDLGIEIVNTTNFIPGEPASYTLQVTNRGPDATNAIVQLPSNGILDDLAWERATTIQSELTPADHANVGPSATAPEAWLGFSGNSTGIGDINGDGVDDILFSPASKFPAPVQNDVWVVFGSESPEDALLTSELDGSNGFKLTGIERGPSSIAGGGDLNGDGITDLVIGADRAGIAENGEGSRGLTYVLFGTSSGFDSSIDLSQLNGERGFIVRGTVELDPGYGGNVGSHIGTSVDFVNDFNGDGVDDLMIGGRGVQYAFNSAVYVVFGRQTAPFPAEVSVADLDGSNGFRVTGDGYLGQSVADVGDINGDGLTDIAMGWFSFRANATVLFGTTDAVPREFKHSELNEDQSMTVRGDTFLISAGYPSADDFGASVDGLGDVNGDGLDDMVIGTPTTDSEGRARVGQGYVVFGSNGLPHTIEASSLDGAAGFQISTRQEFQGLGDSVAGVGDVDGDGLQDILITSTRAEPGAHNAWLLYGSSGGFNSVVDPLDIGSYEGIALGELKFATAAGDFDHDGKSDLLLGRDGTAHLFVGRARPNGNEATGDTAVDGNVPLLPFTTTSYHVSGIVRAEVMSDFPISATVTSSVEDPQMDNNSDEQLVRVFRDVDLATSSTSFATAKPGQPFSLEFTVTNQGLTEAVGTGVQSEFSNLFLDPSWKKTTIDPRSPIELIQSNELGDANGLDLGDPLAVAVGRAGDFNGDGLTDIVTIAEQQMEVLLGSTSPTVDADRLVFRSEKGLRDAIAAGDLNGDGLSDLIVRSADWAEHFVVFGQTAPTSGGPISLDELDGTSGFRITSEGPSRQMVYPVGDVNADGYDEFAVTAGSHLPLLRILPGRSSFEATLAIDTVAAEDAILTLTGKGSVLPGFQNGNWQDVAAAGDVNDDGFGDIVVGISVDFSGAALVVFGGPETNSELDVSTLTPEQGFAIQAARPRGAVTVAGVGDVNGDGLDDVAIGFDGEEPSDVIWTNLTVAFGSTDTGPVETLDVSALGYFGQFEVGAAGDINADGIDDVLTTPGFHLLGAPEFDGLDSALSSLQEPYGFRGPLLRNIGDFNGDQLDDFLVDNFLLFGEATVRDTLGTGPISESIDLAPGARVVYAVSGTVAENATGDAIENSLSASVGPLRTDSNPQNNSSIQRTALANASRGDINLDGIVDFADFLILSANFGKQNRLPSQGDVDGNGAVDLADFLVLAANFGRPS